MKKRATNKKKSKPISRKKITTQKAKTQKVKKKVAKKSAAQPKKTSKKVSPIPKGNRSITPYVILKNAAKAIAFYKEAFGAKEITRMEFPHHHPEKICHAELRIGDSSIMLSDESPEMNAHGPQAFGGSPVFIHLYIKDVDKVVERAVAAGAKLIKPVEDMFWGDRSGTVEDPYGHKWCVSTHIENLSSAKIKKRAAEFFAQQAEKAE